MPKIRHVLFDFDGTLADSRALIIRLYNDLAERYGFGRIDEANLEALRALSLPDRGRALGIPVLRIPELAVKAKRRYRTYIEDLEPIAGIPELLHKLQSAGVTLTILSSNSEATIGAFLAKAGLPPFAEVLSSRGLFAKHQALRSWMKRHRVRPDEVLYVGDEHRDAVACVKAGVRMIGVAWGYDAPELLREAGASAIVSEPLELLAYVTGKVASPATIS
ncbi:HAD hydrolase-like protein [Paenibacillus chartarius]|uniref:HAD hydrolase-like protein n=1 Tax=Paenibacillus chartarius TaxID=747481 RepID=A0ABV6DKC4_9BACL